MSAPALDQWQHKGWDISADYGCPDPWSTWQATAPGWEPDYDPETGRWYAGEGCVRARTYEELLEAIEDAIADEVLA